MRSDKDPRFEAVGVHMILDGMVLLVQRPAHKRHPLSWSAVGGKIEPEESAHDALIREVREETGITLDHVETLSVGLYEHGGIAFRYYQFLCVLDTMPVVMLNDEHIGHGWFTIAQARVLPLMEDELELLEETMALLEEREST